MIKLIEFLGRLVVRGYRRASVLERKVEKKTADGAADAAALADKLTIASLEAGMKARQADTKADQLEQFFKD
ncbi:hypothetical protein CKV1F_gp17 [Escherichia phage K1F]|uniref:Gp3.7 protein n=1 Tax=Escherichia phage K1F TaxID=344021 RepID=Q3YJY5_BPK1F|nr:hypothetical protein CKV1F_gp17 [Escherichia phage K1F]YP_424933.1 gp3.7 protein [Escherichia phage K1F]AAZ72980.1 unknown [Escherichia phage K1F]CAJ29364.1 gp3.7 protein [Escherichia phage K1F]